MLYEVITECFGHGTATFLILGNRCTRNCGFCAIDTGSPEPVQPDEPLRVAKAGLSAVEHLTYAA